MKQYIGLGKTKYNSSLCFLQQDNGKPPEPEIFLSERVDRRKASGRSPLFLAMDSAIEGNAGLAESTDVASSLGVEDVINSHYPFREYMSKRGREQFLSGSARMISVGHHLAHASAAVIRSPFEKALVVVMDGAGSSGEMLGSIKQGEISSQQHEVFEHFSVYTFEHGKLKNVRKEFMRFFKWDNRSIGTSPGIFYENIARYIFNSSTDPGKVMGLSAFGQGSCVTHFLNFQKELDWNNSFTGKTKEEWEQVSHMSEYRNIAATAQLSYETFFLRHMEDLRKEFPEYENLILTGGCTLNCVANWKLQEKNLFRQIYVSPYPGDESVGLGCSAWLWFQENAGEWIPTPWSEQNSFLGAKANVPHDSAVQEIFRDFETVFCEDVSEVAASAIANGEIIGWFQGRSECGPRSLGHRSILARPDRTNLKDYLNRAIKFRESFRPYGCTVKLECAHKYFRCGENFQNPFMSFTVPVRDEHRELLKHVTHVDGTSRMQTLSENQEPLFYRLLSKVEEKTGTPIVLNTSLNVMGEPIVETLEDARRFLLATPVDALFVGHFMIRKKHHV